MLILHTFPGAENEPPDADLVALMIKKAEEYHCCQKPVTLSFDYIHRKEDGTPVFDHTGKQWHLWDPRIERGGDMNRLMVESCKGMMEGLYEGWMLGSKPLRDAAKAKAEQKAERARKKKEAADLAEWEATRGW